MIIKFKMKSELEIVDNYDEKTDEFICHDEIFKEGEEVECDLVEDNGERVNVQFSDGSMVYGLDKNCFEVKEV